MNIIFKINRGVDVFELVKLSSYDGLLVELKDTHLGRAQGYASVAGVLIGIH
jgi:hypothetical protein